MGITVSKELQAALDSKGLTLTGKYFRSEHGTVYFELSDKNFAFNDGFISRQLTFSNRVQVHTGVLGYMLTQDKAMKLLKKHLNN